MMTENRRTISQVRKGDFSLFGKTLSQTDVMLYAGISGDMEPLCMNTVFAREAGFKGRLVHPMHLAAIAEGAVFRYFRAGAVIQKNTWVLKKPAYAGDTVTARAEVAGVDPESSLVTCNWECYDQNRDLLMEGEASVWLAPSGKEDES